MNPNYNSCMIDVSLLKYYYKVVAKCGHVGRGKYIPIPFYVKANSASEAANFVKGLPRVKAMRDNIISVEEITRDEYKAGREENRNNPYFHHTELTDDELSQIEAQTIHIINEHRANNHKKIPQEHIDGTWKENKEKRKDFIRKKQEYKLDSGRHMLKGAKYKIKTGPIYDI